MAVLSDNVAIGPEARCIIDGVNWGIVDGTFRHTVDEVVVTDTETSAQAGAVGVFDQRRQGLQNFEFNATMQFDDTIGLVFSAQMAPATIAGIGTFVLLKFLPDKFAPTDYYHVPRFRVYDSSGNFAVRGSAPVTMRISGKNDGPFNQVLQNVIINGGPGGL